MDGPGTVDRPGGAPGSRHDSLIGALDVSMTLLSPRERTLLGLVSTLPGPFPLAAAEELASAVGLTTDCVVGMARLVEASLIQSHPGDPWSYSSLQTIQVYGRTLLDDEMARLARGGLVRWATEFARYLLTREGPEEVAMNVEVTRFLPLVRAALQVARDHDDVPAQRRIISGVEGGLEHLARAARGLVLDHRPRRSRARRGHGRRDPPHGCTLCVAAGSPGRHEVVHRAMRRRGPSRPRGRNGLCGAHVARVRRAPLGRRP